MLKTKNIRFFLTTAFCDSQNKSLVFLQPDFSSPFCQSISTVVIIGVWAAGAVAARPEQQDTTVLLLYYYCASATVIMASPAWLLISPSNSDHPCILACVISALIAQLYTSFLPQHDDFTVAMMAGAEEAYTDDKKRDLRSGKNKEIIFPQHLFCFLWKKNKAENQDQVLFYVGSLDENIDIKSSIMDCEYGSNIYTLLLTCIMLLFKLNLMCSFYMVNLYISLISADL